MYHCNLKEEDFFHIYSPYQRGGAIGADGSIYYTPTITRQKGRGIGGIFGALARRVIPFLKKYVVPVAKQTLKNVAVDVLDNDKNVLDAVKQHGIKGLSTVASNVINQSGSGRRGTKRPASKKNFPNNKKKKPQVKRPRNIFNQ